jgi:hypothetical protein
MSDALRAGYYAACKGFKSSSEQHLSFTTAISDMKANDLAALGIHCQPNPLLVRLVLYEARHFVGFDLKALDHDVRVAGDRLDIEMIGQGFKAVDNKAQEPLEFDSHGATNAAQRQAFQQQALDQNSCFLRDAVLLEALDKLTATVLALMVLLAIVNVTVFLELG